MDRRGMLGGMLGLAAWPGAVGAACGGEGLRRLVDDMRLPHEGAPMGVPGDYDWAEGPRLGYGNEPPPKWRAFIAWGQLYEEAGGNPARNARVEIRDMAAWRLDRLTGAWVPMQRETRVAGAAYRADFAGDESRPADLREEPGGGVSVTAGAGWNFHFWPASGRVPLEPASVGGLVVTVRARLVPGDPGGPDDRAAARYLLSVGADYWRSLDARWQADWSANGDAAIGRFRRVGPEWRTFTMTTLDEAALRANPPPEC